MKLLNEQRADLEKCSYKIAYFLQLGILFFLLLFFGSSCEQEQKEFADADIDTFSADFASSSDVVAQILSTTEFSKQIHTNGKIRARQKIDMHFKTGDYLVAIRVKNGDKVSKGAVLAELDTTILHNQLVKAMIALDKAQQQLKTEIINYTNGMYPDSTLKPEILKTLKIRSGVFEAENSIREAQLQLSYATLKAPISGVVANLEKRAGSYITPADIFCTIIDHRSLEASFPILESELGAIQKGQALFFQSFANPEKKFKAYISEINPLVDENGLILVKATIKSKTNRLFDGMNIKVIIDHASKELLVIPKDALVTRGGKEVVFTLEGGKAKWNYVEIIDENSSSYAVQKGLNVGDTILVAGNTNLAHDTRVNVSLISME